MDRLLAPAAMRTGIVNVFQRLVRQWEKVHPYNAAQIMQLKGPADLKRLGDAWCQTVGTAGVGSLRVDGHHLTYEPGEPPELFIPQAGVSLEEHITRELNAPFAQTTCPFRPFILDAGDSHYAGVVYQHWVADSASIRLLMQDWLARMCEPAKARTSPLTIPTGGYWEHFGPVPGRWLLPDGLMAAPRWTARFRLVRKIRTQASADFSMAFIHRPAPDGLIEDLRSWAHGRKATVNDLFLACMAEACARFVPRQRPRRRRNLALGTIVDLRGERAGLADTFGLFLGFTNVVCQPADLADFERLVRCIAAQTRRQKADNAANASMVWMSLATACGRFLPLHKTYRFYSKGMPLAGGISNVNLNQTWAAEYHPSPLMQYIRVSPTGPMIPLAFTPTTLGRTLHLGLTYRRAVIGPEVADEIAAHFLHRLTTLPQGGLR